MKNNMKNQRKKLTENQMAAIQAFKNLEEKKKEQKKKEKKKS